MYLGEARIKQERINEFLEIARNLQIKEFMKDFRDEQAIEQDPVEPCHVDNSMNTDKTENRSVLNSIDELLDLDIPGFENSVDKQVVSSNQLHKCQDCESVFKNVKWNY